MTSCGEQLSWWTGSGFDEVSKVGLHMSIDCQCLERQDGNLVLSTSRDQ